MEINKIFIWTHAEHIHTATHQLQMAIISVNWHFVEKKKN